VSEIFPSDPSAAEKPTDYLANPVRVQTPEMTGAQHDRRPYTRLDLIALANTIVTVQRHHSELAHEISNLRIVIENQRITIERLTAVVTSPVVWRFLTTLAKSGETDDTEYEPEDPY